jgi:hypothetical protein
VRVTHHTRKESTMDSMIMPGDGGIIRLTAHEAKELYAMIRRTQILETDEDVVEDIVFHLKSIQEM